MKEEYCTQDSILWKKKKKQERINPSYQDCLSCLRGGRENLEANIAVRGREGEGWGQSDIPKIGSSWRATLKNKTKGSKPEGATHGVDRDNE
mmetsp:Transcript_31193/g.61509  ORF Transcript_31193/g.61509 Transcript_31193/m.61509 type:complete len:92 (+) Transcript_31193:1529-1804(+)